MFFTRGCTSSLDAIADLFTKYVDCSGQVCNPAKSTMFAGSIAVVRRGFLASRIGFKMGPSFLLLGIYSWPVNLIETIESWCRNFIWSGNIHRQKLVIVASGQCCQDIQAGSLGIRSPWTLNEANNLVQCWSIINETNCWASILKARVFKRNMQIKYHVFLVNLDR
ncbi:unnamed protein product [Vicia faba]|nr:unnamed protein product [Vicia faba]